MTPNDPRKSDPDYIDPAILKERAAVRDMVEVLAEVLAKHEDFGLYSEFGGDTHYVCSCDRMMRPGSHRAHVAQALAAAGFGYVASVERERDEALALHAEQHQLRHIWQARAETAEARLARTQETLDSWQMNESRFAVIREIDADIRAALIAPVDRE